MSDWRLNFVKAVMVFLFIGLIIRIGYLQLHLGEKYKRQSTENRLRIEEIDPVRGLIFDRKGRLLVENRPGYTLMGIASSLRSNIDVLHKLDMIFGNSYSQDWMSLIEKNLKKLQCKKLPL